MSLSYLQWKMRRCQLIVFFQHQEESGFYFKHIAHLRKHALCFGVSGNPDVQSGKTRSPTLKEQHQLFPNNNVPKIKLHQSRTCFYLC